MHLTCILICYLYYYFLCMCFSNGHTNLKVTLWTQLYPNPGFLQFRNSYYRSPALNLNYPSFLLQGRKPQITYIQTHSSQSLCNVCHFLSQLLSLLLCCLMPRILCSQRCSLNHKHPHIYHEISGSTSTPQSHRETTSCQF